MNRLERFYKIKQIVNELTVSVRSYYSLNHREFAEHWRRCVGV